MTTPTRLATYSINFAKFLGLGIQKTSIITSALLAGISFFYIFTLGSYLQVTVYILIWRVTYINAFDDYLITRYFDGIIISLLSLMWMLLSIEEKVTRIVVSTTYGMFLVITILANLPMLLHIAALSSLPIIVFFLAYQKKVRSQQKRVVRNFSLGLTLNYLVLIVIGAGILTILFSLSMIIFSKFIAIHNYGYDAYLFFSTLSPLLLIVIIFCFPVKFLTKNVIPRIPRLDKQGWLQYPGPSLSPEAPGQKRSRNAILVYLSLSVLFSISLAMIPHLSTINIDNQEIGQDSNHYADWINSLAQTKNAEEFFYKLFAERTNDRPLSLLLIYALTKIVNVDPFYTVEYLPLILGPALVLVIYWLTRELTSNETTSLLAAFLTSVTSFHLLIGIYAGFYANWIALIFGFLSCVFLFRYVKKGEKRNFFIFFALIVVLELSHVYAWTMFALAIGIFLGTSLIFKYYPKKRLILLLLVLLSSVIIDVTRSTVPETAAGGIERGAKMVQAGSLGIDQLVNWWNSLVIATQHKLGSIYYTSFILLALVFFWLLRSDLRHPSNMFIGIFMSLGIIPLFFGDWVVQSRVFYNFPFQIPAAIALTYISRHKNGTLILLPMYVWLIAISIRTVSNFYEVLPS